MKITRQQFDKIYPLLNIDPKLNKDFIFSCLTFALEGAEELINKNVFGKVVPLNPVSLCLYISHEYSYNLKLNDYKLDENDELMEKVVSMSLDKYFTNEHLNFANKASITKYDPEISTLATYLNFVLNVLSKVSKRNPSETLIVDVLYKSFSMSKAIIELLDDGFETEAFSTWRTLHESECVLALLIKYGKDIRQAYLKHINYMMAFRGIIADKEKVDNIFIQIKDEMKALSLKSKDMKKYIEYGWLTAISNYQEVEQFKFNFRDGVERLAGLSQYSKTYEMASEIAHSSPVLIYSKSTFFYQITLINLYESFFRLEVIFSNIYKAIASEDEYSRFLTMKNIYYRNLMIIYNDSKKKFKGV